MHYVAVERYVSRRFDGLDRADLLSLTFATAWRRIDSCPSAHDDARGWLIGIARNTARNAVRAQRRRHRMESQLMTAPVTRAELHDVQLPSDVAQRLAAALDGLRPGDREVIELAAFHGLTGSALAAALDVSVTAANVRLHRARRRLEACFEDVDDRDG